ncbi:MAG: TonB-dependent receptor [Bacteroides sp.]|nr:TonB-dependent receptor [Bacteroides sp.]
MGNSTYDKSNYAYKVTSVNTASPYLTDPSNPSRVNGAEIVGISSGSSILRTVAFFGNAEYKLLDRYVINGSLRSDGDLRFGKEHQWSTFPSASLRWRISGEPFMRWTDKFMDDFSIRASWGINENSLKASYGHIGLYDIYDYSCLGEVGTYLKNMELSDLRWERTTQQNLEIDLSILNNRLRFGVDIYKKRTNDLFFSNLGIPTSTGYSRLNMNVGTMDNQGWELSINTIPVRGRNLRVSFNFNIARNQNYIREIFELYPMEKGTGLSNGDYLRRYEIDQPMGSIYGYKYDGVYLNRDQTIARDKNGEKIYTYDEYGHSVPVRMRFGYPSIDYEFQPGDARYVDINNDGNIDYQDIVYLGNTNPKFTGGFGPTVTYKDFTVSAFFNFRYGNKIVNSTKIILESMSSYNNQSTATLRRWRHEYENEADVPSDLLPCALAAGCNRLGSDRFVEDGSFLRMKSLSIKYQANRKWLTKNTPFT